MPMKHAAVRTFSPFTTVYPEITASANRYNESFAFDAIAASFGIGKIFRFFDLQRNLLILRKSISRGAGDLSNFTIILMVVLVGFAISGMNIFGPENAEYVDVMKIDVEGHELKARLGAKNLFDKYGVGVVFLEWK